MICEACNKQIRDGAKFCGQCGAKTKVSAAASITGSSEPRYELKTLSVNATGPDSDGDLSVEIKVAITNRSGAGWDQVNTHTQLISASGFIEETSDSHDLVVEDGETEEFEVNFYGVKARPFLANPELTKTIINVVACSASSKKLGDVLLPETSFDVVKVEPTDISDTVKLLSGGVWRTDPDDDKDVRVEARWLVQNLTDTHLPEVRFTAEVVGKSGAEIGDAGGYEELRPGVSAVINGSTYSKEKKLKGALVQMVARVMSPTAGGSSVHIGMELSASDDDSDHHHDEDHAHDDSSDFDLDKQTEATLSGSVSFEWKMENGEINMDDVEDVDVRAALALALGLAKKEKFEDAVKALPSINFEYSFGNLDSDCSDYFGEPQDISFDLDLSDPKHSVSVGVSDGKLIISIAVVFEIPVHGNAAADELNEWLSDNGGYAAGFAAGGWSYNGDEGGHLVIVDSKSELQEQGDIDTEKSYFVRLFSLETARDNTAKFNALIKELGHEESNLLGYYIKEDPLYDPDSDPGLESAWSSCMSINREGKIKIILESFSNFEKNPDIFTLWKYAALINIAGREEENFAPRVSWPSPWPILDTTYRNIDHCIDAMVQLNRKVEESQLSEEEYTDAMGSSVLCYLALALLDKDRWQLIRNLLLLIVENRSLYGARISDDLSYGWGELASMFRRYVEELSGVRVERPVGVDHEEDCYLDNVDWGVVAEEISDIA